MDERELFIKKFVEAGQSKGATKQEVSAKLQTALQEYDSLKKPKSTLEKVGEFVAPATTRVIKDIGASVRTSGQIKQQDLASDQALALSKQAMQERIKQQEGLGTGQNIPSLTTQSKNLAGQTIDTSGFSTDVEKGALKRGFGLAGEVGSYLVPASKAVKGATTAQRIANAGITGATIGTISGATDVSNEGVVDTLKTTAERGLTGALFGAGLQGGAEVLSKVTPKATEFIKTGLEKVKRKGLESYASTFKENKTAEQIINRLGGPENAAQQFIDNKIPKTKTGVVKEIRKLNKQYDKQVTDKLKTIGQTRNKDLDPIIDGLIEEGKKTYFPQGVETPKSAREFKAYENYLNSFRGKFNGPKGNLNNLNNLRKSLDQTYKGVSPSNVVDGEKLANDLLSNEIRNTVQSSAPITKNFFKRYSLLKSAEQVFYKEPKIGFNELLGALVAGSLGGVNLGTAVVGGVGARVLKSPALYRGVSETVAGSSPRTSKLLEVIKKPTERKTPLVNPKMTSVFDAYKRYLENN